MSKPRGGLGKYGNMTHSLNGYREWQREFALRLKSVNFSLENHYAIMYRLILSKRKRGRPQDVTDMIGALEDVFVQYNFIKDDNWRRIPRYWGEAIQGGEESIIEIYVLMSESEIPAYFQAIKK